MIGPPPGTIHNPDVLPALRELLSDNPQPACCAEEQLANRLRLFAGRRPPAFEIEAALEALRLDSWEVAA